MGLEFSMLYIYIVMQKFGFKFGAGVITCV